MNLKKIINEQKMITVHRGKKKKDFNRNLANFSAITVVILVDNLVPLRFNVGIIPKHIIYMESYMQNHNNKI